MGPPHRASNGSEFEVFEGAAKRMEEGGGDRRPDDHEGELEVR